MQKIRQLSMKYNKAILSRDLRGRDPDPGRNGEAARKVQALDYNRSQ